LEVLYEWENFRKSSAESNRADRPKQFYPIFFNTKTEKIRLPKMVWQEPLKEWELLEQTLEDEVSIYPLNPSGAEKVWQWGTERVEREPDELKVQKTRNRLEVYKMKYWNEEGVLPRTWWDNPSYSARDSGTAAITNLFGDKQFFDFPKAVQAVKDCLTVARALSETTTLDFFGGSGTTANAIIELNREDEGKRRFVLVEMGDHFDTVLNPRVQKVMYSPDWRDAKPRSQTEFPLGNIYPDWVTRSPRLVKVLRLESYEDSLNALELPHEQDARAKGLQDLFGDGYFLKYMLPSELEGSEVFLSAERLEKPFDYKLRIHTGEGVKEQAVDIVETFNLLMGFHVKRVFRLNSGRDYVCVEAEDANGLVLVLWRDLKDLDPAAEREFLEKTLDMSKYTHLYVNGDSALPKAQSLDAEFKNRLLARSTGIVA
jgi:adenine-specific DNA-methyltransferase